MKPAIRKKFRLLSMILSIVLGIIGIWIVLNMALSVIYYVFLPRRSEVNLSINQADQYHFSMNTETCTRISELDQDHINFRIANPTNKQYVVRSEEATEPISATISFRGGVLKYVMDSGIKGKIVSDTINIGDNQRYNFTAQDISVNLLSLSDIRFLSHICASDVIYDDRSGQIYIYNDAFDKSIITNLNIPKPSEVVTFTVKGMFYNSNYYPQAEFVFVGDVTSARQIIIRTSGRNMPVQFPNFVDTIRDDSSISITDGNISAMELQRGDGVLSLQYEQDINLSSPVTGLDEKALILGGDTFWPFSELFDTGFLHIYEKGLFGSDTSGYEITGYVSSAVYAGNQKIRSRWELLSPEVQAFILGVVLGVPGWYINRRLSSERKKIDKTVSIPQGYMVLVLHSGQAVAGKFVDKPTPPYYRYVLSDPYFCDAQGTWRKGNAQFVMTEARKVEYIYTMS